MKSKNKKGKILRKFKGKCLNCKKPMTIIERESTIPWCKKHDIRVANFYCSKKCEGKFKKRLDVAIVYNDGYEKAQKDIIKKIKDETREIKTHMKEVRHPNNGYHQGSIDILDIFLKWIKKN